jgi:hypothetical protein
MKRIVFIQHRGVVGWLCSTLHAKRNAGPLPRAPFTLLLGAIAAAALWAMPGTARGQIYETNSSVGTIGEYNATSGATINSSLVSGLNSPYGIVVSGGNLFVVNSDRIGEYNASTGATINASLVSGLSGPGYGAIGLAEYGGNLFVVQNGSGHARIGEYNATTGATVNASLVTGLNDPIFIAASGGNLFVTQRNANRIGEYNATTGATVNASLVSGLGTPYGIAVSGGNLWVANANANTIGEYNATTGATINSSLVSGLNNPIGLAEYGGNLFVVNNGGGTIGEYNATTGAAINASLVSGLNGGPFGIAAVPEPSTWAAGLLTAGAILYSIWRRRAGWLRRGAHSC